MIELRTFQEKSFFEFRSDYTGRIRNEIAEQEKEYILGVDENEYKKFLYEKYFLEPLTIIKESEERLTPKKVKLSRNERSLHPTHQIQGYRCVVKYKFSGHPILFKLSPSHYMMVSYPVSVDYTNKIISLEFNIDKRDPQLYNDTRNDAFKQAFTNLEEINKEAEDWNSGLANLIDRAFQTIKREYLRENDFFQAINIRMDAETEGLFNAPVIKKKSIPQPKSDKRNFSSSPVLHENMYHDILKVLYDMGSSMERKPATYKNKSEEDIRDFLITMLETRFEGSTASGETFNSGGKTDILVKYEDGTNLFVGECKWWKGEAEFHAAINQLFEKYLTWKDSKTALIFFVKNKEMSAVIQKIQEESKKHQYFLKSEGQRQNGSFSYIFHLPNDKGTPVYLEIMAFHFLER